MVFRDMIGLVSSYCSLGKRAKTRRIGEIEHPDGCHDERRSDNLDPLPGSPGRRNLAGFPDALIVASVACFGTPRIAIGGDSSTSGGLPYCLRRSTIAIMNVVQPGQLLPVALDQPGTARSGRLHP